MPKVRHHIKQTAHKLKRQPARLLKPKQSFSNSQLLVFALIFALIGGYALYRSLAATTTKTWNSQADFNTGSLSNTTATSGGSVTLTPSVGGGGAGSGVSVPGYHMTLPPGGSEPTNGGPGAIWAHWLGVDTASVSLGQEFWAFASMQIDSDSDWPVNGFDPTFNLHVTPSNPAWNGVAVSPIQFDLGGGKMALLTHGGGVFDPNQYGAGFPGYHNVIQTSTPANPPTVVKGVRYDYTIHAKISADPSVGYVQAWYQARDGSMSAPVKITDVHTATMYNSDPGPLSLYYGFYTKGAPQNSPQPNNDKATFKLKVWLPRMGATPAAAAAHTPSKTGEWGALAADPTIVMTTAALSGTDFGYPTETGLAGGSSPTTTYPSTGSVVLTKDALVSSNWSNLRATPTTQPAGTNVVYDARTSTDNTNWSTWNANPANLPAGRYVQVRATLSTTNTSVTPSIDNISIDYLAVADTTPPSAPTGLSAGASDSTHVNLNWISATDDKAVTSYNIYRNGSTTPLANLPASPATVGKTTVGANRASMSSDWKYTNVYPLTTASDISKLSFYVDGQGTTASGSQLFKGVIYAADASGEPSNLLAASNQLTVNHGDAGAWRDLVFPSSVHLNSGTYFIGVISGGTSGVAQDAYDLQTSILRTGTDAYADGPTNPYGSATTANAQLSLYAVGLAPTYTDSTVTANTSYTYQVSAVDAAGNQSPKTAFVNVSTPASIPPPTPPPSLVPGDINGDLHVNFLDLSILVSNYGQPGSRSTGDLNNDSKVDFKDLSVLVANWGN